MPSPERPPGPPPDNEQLRRRLEREELVRLAHANVENQAFTQHRERTRLTLEAPPTPSRGPAGCLTLVVVPIGLLLLTVHPLPGMLVLSLGAVLYLIGSHHLDQTRRRLEQADAEAERRWVDAGGVRRPDRGSR